MNGRRNLRSRAFSLILLEKDQDPRAGPSVAKEKSTPAVEWRPTVSQEQ